MVSGICHACCRTAALSAQVAKMTQPDTGHSSEQHVGTAREHRLTAICINELHALFLHPSELRPVLGHAPAVHTEACPVQHQIIPCLRKSSSFKKRRTIDERFRCNVEAGTKRSDTTAQRSAQARGSPSPHPSTPALSQAGIEHTTVNDKLPLQKRS